MIGGRECFAIAKIHYSCMSATDSAEKESLIYKTFSSHLLQTPQPCIDCLALFCEWYIFVVSVMRRTKHSELYDMLCCTNNTIIIVENDIGRASCMGRV